MFVGVGKSFIAERMLFDGDMPCGDRVRPAKSTVSLCTELEFFLADNYAIFSTCCKVISCVKKCFFDAIFI